jgi:hypothetical protein
MAIAGGMRMIARMVVMIVAVRAVLQAFDPSVS